jgi:hypothetical protein
MTFRHSGYGLDIDSELPLPELAAASSTGASDLRVRFDAGPIPPADLPWAIRLESAAGDDWLRCAKVPHGYLVRFPGDADFFVSADGREIACYAATVDCDEDFLRHLILDQVVPLALKLRGDEVLHATAIATPHGICAFVGPSGSGKSTLAAAFLKAGHHVICDDCLRLDASDRARPVVPAYPGVRVRADTLEAMRAATGTVVPVSARHAKHRWAPAGAREAFRYDHQRLARIYRLMPPDSGSPHRRPRLETMSVREAFVELAGSTFRFDALDRRSLTGEFEMWSHLAGTVPIRRLWLDDDLSCAKARACVLADVSGG